MTILSGYEGEVPHAIHVRGGTWLSSVFGSGAYTLTQPGSSFVIEAVKPALFHAPARYPAELAL